jgi:hypothetical protein
MMEWISIDDFLPIEKTDNFVHYKTVEVIAFDGKSVLPTEFRAGNVLEFWSNFRDSNITHWMPLPGPPED